MSGFNFLEVGNMISSISATTNDLKMMGNMLRAVTLKNLLNGTYLHEKSSGARIKGLIANLEDGSYKRFQYNPRSSEYSRSVNFSTLVSPGMQYPLTYFTSGGIKTFEVELFMYDRNSGKIQEYNDWFEKLLPDEDNEKRFKKPVECLYSYGNVTCRCVVENYKFHIDEYSSYGEPYMAHFTLGMRQVGKG